MKQFKLSTRAAAVAILAGIITIFAFAGIVAFVPGCQSSATSTGGTTQPTTPANKALSALVEFKNAYDAALVFLDGPAVRAKLSAKAKVDIVKAVPIINAALADADVALSSDPDKVQSILSNVQSQLDTILTAQASVDPSVNPLVAPTTQPSK